MNIEELTKSQIFLLTLLTSFVTSMATGIVTVSLVDQTPTTITQSVSRVIQSTVQPTTPDEKTQPVAAAVAVPLQTPPQQPEKAPELSEIVQGVMPSVVRLTEISGGSFVGIGIVLDAEGTVVADMESLSGRQSVNATLVDGTTLKISAFWRDAEHNLVFMSGTSASTTQPTYAPIALSKDAPVMGQTIIGIFGKQSARIASGLIVAVLGDGASIVTTDISATLIERGTPIINKNGALIGISTASSRAIEGSAFIPTSIIYAHYEPALAAKKSKPRAP
ncbi:serine protease [Candidatus Parcubacteria bacterium]|nr:MAG: serine protease [Candidatus Parcubacteria bacterium]